MGKRKRIVAGGAEELPLPLDQAKKKKVVHQEGATPLTIQVIIGTYEKVLHGITASLIIQPKEHREQYVVEFADTFLLNAHTSAIRCLAVRISWINHPLSLPKSGSQDAFRKQRRFCNSCTCMVVEAILTRKCV